MDVYCKGKVDSCHHKSRKSQLLRRLQAKHSCHQLEGNSKIACHRPSSARDYRIFPIIPLIFFYFALHMLWNVGTHV